MFPKFQVGQVVYNMRAKQYARIRDVQFVIDKDGKDSYCMALDDYRNFLIAQEHLRELTDAEMCLSVIVARRIAKE